MEQRDRCIERTSEKYCSCYRTFATNPKYQQDNCKLFYILYVTQYKVCYTHNGEKNAHFQADNIFKDEENLVKRKHVAIFGYGQTGFNCKDCTFTPIRNIALCVFYPHSIFI